MGMENHSPFGVLFSLTSHRLVDGPVCPTCCGTGRVRRSTEAWRVLRHYTAGNRETEVESLEAAFHSFNPPCPYSVVAPDGVVVALVPARALRKRRAVVVDPEYETAVRAVAEHRRGRSPNRNRTSS